MIERATSDVIIADTWPEPIRREHLRAELTPREFKGDFARRLGIAEEVKAALRAKYGHAVRQTTGEPRERFLSRSRAFWEEYEAFNLAFIPEDPVYSKTVSGLVTTTTKSIWQLWAAAAGQFRILESYVGGEATASIVIRVSVARSVIGTGTVPATYTPEKFNTRSPAAATTAYGSATADVVWGTTPETLNNPLFFHSFNAFGGTDRWVAAPGEEIYFVNGEYGSARAAQAVTAVSCHVIFEEL